MQNNLETKEILGVKVNRIDLESTAIICSNWLDGTNQHQIATVNPEFIMAAQKDRLFKDILNKTDLNIADGVGLVYASSFLYGTKNRLIRVTGVDLAWRLFDLANQKSKTIFILGARSQDVVFKATAQLKSSFPKLKIIGNISGYSPAGSKQPIFKEFQDKLYYDQIIEQIKKANPDILLVAYGSPKQDVWIAQNLAKLPSVKIAVGVGGAIDFFAGEIKRAPSLMRSLGLEWLVRLARQPHRINRIITAIIRFPFQVFKSKIFGQK